MKERFVYVGGIVKIILVGKGGGVQVLGGERKSKRLENKDMKEDEMQK